MRDRLNRKMGSMDAEISNLKQKIEQHLMIEKSLKSSVSILLDHEKVSKFGDAIVPYTLEQKRTIVQIQDILKNLVKQQVYLVRVVRCLN